ncbi:hypothetical protein AYI70_g10361, partial [Smittium culicis]
MKIVIISAITFALGAICGSTDGTNARSLVVNHSRPVDVSQFYRPTATILDKSKTWSANTKSVYGSKSSANRERKPTYRKERRFFNLFNKSKNTGSKSTTDKKLGNATAVKVEKRRSRSGNKIVRSNLARTRTFVPTRTASRAPRTISRALRTRASGTVSRALRTRASGTYSRAPRTVSRASKTRASGTISR